MTAPLMSGFSITNMIADINRPGESMETIACRFRGTPDKKIESGNHFFHSPAIFTQYNAKSGGNHPDSFRLRTKGLLLPLSAEFRKKIISLRLVFRKYLIFPVTIITHGRGAAKGNRSSFGYGCDQIPRSQDPAVHTSVFYSFRSSV